MNVYENMRKSNGDLIRGRTKLFIESVDADGNILNFESGIDVVPERTGTLFIVDEWLIGQVSKLKVVDAQLVVKDGETIEEPVKTEEELQEEELLRQLAELRAKRSEEPTE